MILKDQTLGVGTGVGVSTGAGEVVGEGGRDAAWKIVTIIGQM